MLLTRCVKPNKKLFLERYKNYQDDAFSVEAEMKRRKMMGGGNSLLDPNLEFDNLQYDDSLDYNGKVDQKQKE